MSNKTGMAVGAAIIVGGVAYYYWKQSNSPNITALYTGVNPDGTGNIAITAKGFTPNSTASLTSSSVDDPTDNQTFTLPIGPQGMATENIGYGFDPLKQQIFFIATDVSGNATPMVDATIPPQSTGGRTILISPSIISKSGAAIIHVTGSGFTPSANINFLAQNTAVGSLPYLLSMIALSTPSGTFAISIPSNTGTLAGVIAAAAIGDTIMIRASDATMGATAVFTVSA